MRLPLPKPGRAPTLEEILLEAATLRPPPQEIMTPEEQQAVRSITNNPTRDRVPPELLNDPATDLASHGVAGLMPEVGNNVYDEIVQSLIRELDIQGKVYPTIARGISSDNSTPSVLDMMGARGGGDNFALAFGENPARNPEGSLGQIEQMLARLTEMEPNIAAGERSAIEGIATEQGTPTDPYLEGAIADRMETPQASSPFFGLLNELRNVLTTSQQGRNPESAIKLFDQLDQSRLGEVEQIEAMIRAMTLSGTGARPGSDPEAMQSLAATIDPNVMRRRLTASQQPDPSLIMRLMGLE